jgi:hypothetical protein
VRLLDVGEDAGLTTRDVVPHHTPLAAMALSLSGAVLVTASTRGTALKLIDFRSGALLMQLNRGAIPNRVHSIALNARDTLAVCVSETGTAHVFALQEHDRRDGVAARNKASVLQRAADTVGGLGGSNAAVMGPATGKLNNNSFLQNAFSFARGGFAFATFSLVDHDDRGGDGARRLFMASAVALLPGILDRRHAVLLVAQLETGRMRRVRVDITNSASEDGAAAKCELESTTRFPALPL